jgi:hypothetical protein
MGDSVASSKKSKKGAAPAAPELGTFTFADGSTYSGQFVVLNGVKVREGNGSYSSSSESFEGTWAGDRQEGEGTYKFNSGAEYTGSFSQGAFHGQGKYLFPDGAHYEGGWSMNKMHGKGEYVDANKVSFKGDFFNGLYDSGKSFVNVR